MLVLILHREADWFGKPLKNKEKIPVILNRKIKRKILVILNEKEKIRVKKEKIFAKIVFFGGGIFISIYKVETSKKR